MDKTAGIQSWLDYCFVLDQNFLFPFPYALQQNRLATVSARPAQKNM